MQYIVESYESKLFGSVSSPDIEGTGSQLIAQRSLYSLPFLGLVISHGPS